MSERYSIYAVNLDAGLIGGITTQSLTTGVVAETDQTNGQPTPYYSGNRHVAPSYSFTTKTAGDIIDSLDAGVWKTLVAAGDPFIAYLQKNVLGGTRSATGGMTHTVDDGMMFLDSLTCSASGDLEVSVQVHPYSTDGVTAPVTIADAAAILADPTDAERFGIGTVQIAGVTMTSVTNVQINCGIGPYTDETDSTYYPTYRGVQTFSPSITISGLDPSDFDDAGIPLGGKAGTHVNTIIYFRKRSATGFVADITAQHIKVTAAGIARANTVGGGSTESVSVEFALDGYHDGTLEPIVLTNGVAIA